MLRDLTVQNYRCFEDFHIDGLERVNLFVGNNNSGKTSLLEAIYLFVNPDKRQTLFETIENRINYLYIENISFYPIRHLFYQHEFSTKSSIYIESQNDIKQKTLVKFSCSPYVIRNYNFSSPYLDIFDSQYMVVNGQEEFTKISNRSSLINIEDKEYIKTLTVDIREKYRQFESRTNNVLVSANRLFFDKVAFMWDSIVLTSKENKIIEALNIIEEDLERISFSSNQSTNLIRLKLKHQESPVPISSMGEGMYRTLALAMSLVTAENGVLLVDEIETGLHYEAQTDMWRLILETTKELNVQVFATTHSWDCIAAFQEALSQIENKSIGKLFRLDNKYGKIRAVEYNAEDLDIAVRNSIEVR